MRNALHRDHELERRAAHQDEIERAVLVVGGKQPVERQQARQQRREPEDRRADALEQREIRPERERHQRDHDQKEQHAHQRAAADAHGDAHVADEDGGERAHGSPLAGRTASSRSSVRPPSPIGAMRRRQDEAASGQMRPHQIAEALLRRGVERARRLVEQPDRPLDREQPRDRQPPALAGRQIGGGQIGERVEADRRERRVDDLGRCARRRKPAQNRRFSATDSDGFSASWWPR